MWTAQNIVLPSIPEVDASWLHIWSLSPHASKSEVVLLEQGHFHQKILRPSTVWQSQCRRNDGGFYQSLELNNAILRESWGGVDHTEYHSAIHTRSWCKLTSYLKSEPTHKQKWSCPIGARPLSPKNTQAEYNLTKSMLSKRRGFLSIPGIK